MLGESGLGKCCFILVRTAEEEERSYRVWKGGRLGKDRDSADEKWTGRERRNGDRKGAADPTDPSRTVHRTLCLFKTGLR